MCGAVTFTAEPPALELHACHCDMCRRWTGGALLAVAIPPGAILLRGGEDIRRIQSSEWAERAWCDKCGSHLFYRLTADGPFKGQYHVSFGLFDTPEAFSFASEIYIDRKPEVFAFAGQRKTMTKDEVEAKWAGVA